MRVAGVIAEYNPLHNGHRHHLKEARRLTKADFLLCILGGNFTQRGEPAVVNKWARTRMALENGADLVFELPVVYAVRHAQGFAGGAVKLLEATGVVDYLVFGSEHGHITELKALADFLGQENPPFRERLKGYLNEGYPFPAARSMALVDYHKEKAIPGLEGLRAEEVGALIRHPNNILGLEYLQALAQTRSSIRPLTIPRLGAGYHEEKLTNRIASATAIRLALYENKQYPPLLKFMPARAWQILGEEIEAGRAPVFIDSFAPQIITLLRRTPLAELRQMAGVGEGLENRLKDAARSAGTIEDLLAALKTKRYTRTRLQRLLLHFLFNFTVDDARDFSPQGDPCYLRLLGFTPRGRQLLKYIKKRATLPLITKPARDLVPHIKASKRTARMWELECLATDLYVLAYPCPRSRQAGQDYTQPLVITTAEGQGS
ncbi:MAG: nucleotidyltransferase [bacterium]|mgnify:CR=1 FL=1|jgi:predicted nucleotidyltransferase|nr:nucleotidyltransferase [Bacillota bacterium]